MRLLVLACALVLSGCASTQYEKPDPPTGEAPSGNASDNEAPGMTEAPERLVDGANEHVRLSLDDHRVVGSEVTLFLTFENKDEVGEITTKYALLGRGSGSLYFDLAASISPSTTRHFELTSVDDGDPRAPWTNVTLYYTVDTGAEYTDDEAIELDLSGRGLPSKIS